MIGHVTVAEGSPCPTLVLDKGMLPQNERELTKVLGTIRDQMRAEGLGHVLKIALISRSEHPLFDLDYHFVQCIPGERGDTFDYLGSCGHSIVASVMVANQMRWITPLTPGNRVRVNVVNNDDNVVCEVDEVDHTGGSLTVHFLQEPMVALKDLLVTGSPVDILEAPSGTYELSLVSMGNPYVFVRAHDLGVHDKDHLFADDQKLFDTLVGIRQAAGQRWGWPSGSAFPKIAAIDSFAPGRISVRAISVPTWHPTLALTGATCLGAASVIPGTVAHKVAGWTGCASGPVHIETPTGVTTARPVVHDADVPSLSWVSVSGKRGRYMNPVLIELFPKQSTRESQSWLQVSV
jgi:2-methylaconitate cis-trans-isomerase PrpF